ncbi:hypothetical protein RDI58_002745 [Solanum bulbocastanum]|uniref:Uncharacterized protein n=1 Tax=Solanum bulbocastanum TaxID=147425 RepID=A0AAN8YRG8_SOLBU
MMEKKLKEQ